MANLRIAPVEIATHDAPNSKVSGSDTFNSKGALAFPTFAWVVCLMMISLYSGLVYASLFEFGTFFSLSTPSLKHLSSTYAVLLVRSYHAMADRFGSRSGEKCRTQRRFFRRPFSRRPIMPGVLMLEGMAQLSGLLLEASLKQKFGQDAKAILVLLERTKFREMIRPGDTLIYRTTIGSFNAEGGKASVEAVRDGKSVTTTGMIFAFQFVDDPALEARRSELMKVWMQPQ
jgi:3-hydroxyacyl-[acyl-carrier-protein] dehydratase